MSRVSTCSLCGEVFTTVGNFDKHHIVDYKRRPPVTCTDPADAGLLLDSFGRWHAPGKGLYGPLTAEQAGPGVTGRGYVFVGPVPEPAGLQGHAAPDLR